MRSKILISCAILFLNISDSYSQGKLGFNHYQFITYIGPSYFLGDLGGTDQKGSQRSPVDLNIGTTGYSVGAGIIRKFDDRFSMRLNYIQSLVRGSDSYTNDVGRKNRNLSFRSKIEELSTTLDYNIITFNNNQRYTQNILAFVGVGVFKFNPQANYNGKWYDLQPLGTEGQGLIPGISKYKRTSYNIPFGIGYNMAISENQKIGLILTMRKTFTDYIDDVSNKYYDNSKLVEAHGEIAGRLADRNLDRESGKMNKEGAGRGNPKNNDNFAYLQISYSFRFYVKKSTHNHSFFNNNYKNIEKCFKRW